MKGFKGMRKVDSGGVGPVWAGPAACGREGRAVGAGAAAPSSQDSVLAARGLRTGAAAAATRVPARCRELSGAAVRRIAGAACEGCRRARVMLGRMRDIAGDAACEQAAQGTTEYAILVGVLVVIAILAIIAFRDKVSELWNAISSGINSL